MSLRSALRAIAASLLCCSTATAIAADAPRPDRAAAAAWLQQAEALLAAGSSAEADAMAVRALELDPGWSDALALRAIVAFADRAGTRAAIELAVSALRADSWSRSDPDTTRLALAAAYVRTRRPAEALAILEELARRRPENPDALLLLAQARRDLGRAADGLATADLGRRRFPRDARFALASATYLAAAGRAREARALVTAAVEDTPNQPALLLRLAELEVAPARKLAAVERFLAAGGADPLAATLALESGAAAKEAARFVDLFIAQGGLGRQDLLSRVRRALTGAPAAALSQAVERYSGPRELDADRDGWWEERWEISAGSPVRWIRDFDQDGNSEMEATLQAGVPVSLAYPPSPGVRFTVVYSAYPAADRVREDGPEGSRTWLLSPRSLSVPFLNERSPRLPSAAAVRSAAAGYEETVSGAAARRVQLASGQPVYLEEDADGDGVIDHRLWYSGGTPVRGQRDLTGDGIFEASESWRDGRLEKTLVDSDGDSRTDYAEVISPVPSRMWDYDQDGTWDSREVAQADGTVVREFCTGLDGTWDLRIVFRGERIVTVSRAGTSLAATRDAARGMTWIGAVPRAASIDRDTPEGVRSLGGRRYLVFRYAGTLYAEELP